MDLYSHANTYVQGNECLKIYYCKHPDNVSVWNPKDGKQICQTISETVAYNHPQSRQLYILIFHQCIHVENLDHHLLCSMQCQINSVDVNETPNFLLKIPTDTSHALVVDDTDGMVPMIVSLSITNVTSYFPCRKLTHTKLEDCDVLQIDFTAEAPYWYRLD